MEKLASEILTARSTAATRQMWCFFRKKRVMHTIQTMSSKRPINPAIRLTHEGLNRRPIGGSRQELHSIGPLKFEVTMSKPKAPPPEPESQRPVRFGWKDVAITLLLVIAALQMGYRVRFGTDGVTAEPPSRSKPNRPSHLEVPTGGPHPFAAALPPETQGNGTPGGVPEKADGASQGASDMELSVEGYMDLLDYAVTIKQHFICTLSPSQPSDPHSKSLVRACEVCLKVLGRYDPPLNDDAQTLSTTIIRFQLENRLKPDGIVGGRTWKVLKNSVSKALKPLNPKAADLVDQRSHGGRMRTAVPQAGNMAP